MVERKQRVSSVPVGRRYRKWGLAAALLLGASGCDDHMEPSPSGPSLEERVEALDRGNAPTLSVATIGGSHFTVGTDEPAPIYLLASVSKPVVGLAVAYAVQTGAVDLDSDVNDWLAWDPPFEHPDYPGAPITLRQLTGHTSGLASDAPFDYETYPKPDPDQSLDAFMRRWAGPQGRWTASEPGAEFEYSNLGAAMAALVVEKATGAPFDTYCRWHIFDPLGLDDTAWTLAAYDEDQLRRVQLPHDVDGEPLEHYAFNDYPSGLLRSTTADFAKLLSTISSGGAPILKQASVDTFENAPLFIEAREVRGRPGFGHDGGEAGVVASFAYDDRGYGWVYVLNGEFETDDELDAFQARLEAVLSGG